MKQNFKLRPLKGVKRKEKIEFDQKKCVFDILSSNNFVFCLEKTKLLNDKIAKTHFFWSNSIFSLRLTPFRGRSLKFCFRWSYFELCARLKHENSIFCRFKFTPPPSEARSERSEVRAKRGSSYVRLTKY